VSPGAGSPVVRFEKVGRRFGEVLALEEVSLEILDGEFFSLLGPSGSGKTTCLRLIAGFERPDTGRIELLGRDAARLPPYARDVNTVFQDYALFPHMTVGENVAYGLRIRGVPAADRERGAAAMLDLVRLPGVANRRPSELSGGQRQRVALARALINRPRVLLLDEPLGALDLKLRQQMQVELKGIQEQLGITFIHVTHDQEEALAMSDRLAVLRGGRVEQIGTPGEVYERPATAFVADFVGTSNLIAGEVARAISGSPEAFTIRPEKIRMADPAAPVPEGSLSVTGRIEDVLYLGMHTRYRVAADNGALLTVVEQNLDAVEVDVHAARGRPVRLVWPKSRIRPVAGGGA
jgi:putative spermidine/putrescine transport system ATP-binding protein